MTRLTHLPPLKRLPTRWLQWTLATMHSATGGCQTDGRTASLWYAWNEQMWRGRGMIGMRRCDCNIWCVWNVWNVGGTCGMCRCRQCVVRGLGWLTDREIHWTRQLLYNYIDQIKLLSTLSAAKKVTRSMKFYNSVSSVSVIRKSLRAF